MFIGIIILAIDIVSFILTDLFIDKEEHPYANLTVVAIGFACISIFTILTIFNV